MAKNTSVTLGDHFDSFITQQLQSGRYGSASEVIRAGLRLLERSETRLERLKRLVEDGQESGIAEYSYAELIAELDDEESN